jgi:hypothetical protein
MLGADVEVTTSRPNCSADAVGACVAWAPASATDQRPRSMADDAPIWGLTGAGSRA